MKRSFTFPRSLVCRTEVVRRYLKLRRCFTPTRVSGFNLSRESGHPRRVAAVSKNGGYLLAAKNGWLSQDLLTGWPSCRVSWVSGDT